MQTIGNIHYVGNLIGNICWNFCVDDVIVVSVVVFRTQSLQYFSKQFSCTTHLLIILKVMRKMTMCNKQMLHVLMLKIIFHFLTCRRPNWFKHLCHLWMSSAKQWCWLLLKEPTNDWLHLSIWCTICCEHILEWMAFAQTPFAHQKTNSALFIIGCFQWQC